MTMPTKMRTDINGSTLLMEVFLNHPRTLVFQSFSQPSILEQWWGPEGWQTKIDQFEFRNGGEWHYCMQYVGMVEKEVHAKAIFEEINEPRSIIYRDVALAADVHKNGDKPEMQTTIEFQEEVEGTNLIFHVKVNAIEDLQKIIAMGHKDGMEMQLNRLSKYLDKTNR